MIKQKSFEEFPSENASEAEKEAWRERNLPDLPASSRQLTLTVGDKTEKVDVAALKEMSFDDLAAAFGVTTAAETLGQDQWGPILEEKVKLVGEPFLIVAWLFNDGDFGKFVTMHVLTRHDERFIVNDGSTGIRDQLLTLTAKTGQTGMVMCPHGFRVSEYTYEGPDGVDRPAKTFYIDVKL